MKQNILQLMDQVKDTKLQATFNRILREDRFWSWPGSLSHHHDYKGGLAKHTFEVAAELQGISGLDQDIAITSAIWHDFAKIYDYDFISGDFTPTAPERFVCDDDGCWIQTAYYKSIRHISGSAIEFVVEARKHGVSAGHEEAVVHCILAHHGRPEWGSAITPRSREALALHFSDMLSAQKK